MDTTLRMMETISKALCQALRYFVGVTCPQYKTKELPCEVNAHTARQRAQAARRADANKNVPKTVKGKQFNTSMYKIHCIPNYPDTIQKYGTTDSYSTQMVGYLYFISKYSSDNCRASLRTIY